VTIQAQILRELRELCAQEGTAIIMVTHDLGVVADVAQRVIVMYAGRVVEQARIEDAFYDPQHPYTWGLLGSISRIDRERPQRLPSIPGSPPSLVHPPAGCHFRPRCPHAHAGCDLRPLLEQRCATAEHLDRCILEPGEKRELRRVNGGIGLQVEGSVTA
jgi:peptide/nickel transport system ATP-binding protein/oligopeptide transport system ATP-binding protein